MKESTQVAVLHPRRHLDKFSAFGLALLQTPRCHRVSRGTLFAVLRATVSSKAKTQDLFVFPGVLRAPHDQEDPGFELCLLCHSSSSGSVPSCGWLAAGSDTAQTWLCLPTLSATTPQQAMKPWEKHKSTPKQDPSCPFLWCFRFLWEPAWSCRVTQPAHTTPPGMRDAAPFASCAATWVPQAESLLLGALGCLGGSCPAGGAQPPEQTSPPGLWLSTGSIPVLHHSIIPWN